MFFWGIRNPTDLTSDQNLFQIPCNCGGQITFLNLSDPNAGTLNTYWIMIDIPAKAKQQFILQVKPGIPVTVDAPKDYLQEGQYHGLADNPSAVGADILHWFGTFRPAVNR